MNKEIGELNQGIHEALEQLSEANRYKKLIKSTEEEKVLLEKKWGELEEALKKEERDVEKLKKISLSNLVHTLFNNKTEKMDKEQREAMEAKIKCDTALAQLNDCKADLDYMKKKYDELVIAEREYKLLMAKKKELIEKFMPDKWRKIEELIEEQKTIGDHTKEIIEATHAGQRVLQQLNRVNKSLDSAEDWGMWDMLGGGMISTMIKHDKMDEAQNYIQEAQRLLTSFNRELADVNVYLDMEIRIDSFLGFADYFFDSFFVDYAVQNKINEAQNKIRTLESQVNSIMAKLKHQLEQNNNKKKILDNNIEDIIKGV